jgi:hypothetical protein
MELELEGDWFGKKFIQKEITGSQLNKLHNNKPFYKIIRKNKNHYDMIYKLGLNKDILQFYPYGTCNAGGMYFTTIENIFYCIHYGYYVCNITIPNDARCYVENFKIKTNKFIINNFIPFSKLKQWYNSKFCEMAVQQDGIMLKHVQIQTKNIVKLAVQRTPYALIHSNADLYTDCLVQIFIRDEKALQHFKETVYKANTVELISKLIKKNI